MPKIKRKIIKIDEDKCDGCGLCAEACHEGAIQIIDGKAKLVSESYCDGLGDCIGECPRGAISFEEREAEAYDEEAVMKNKAQKACGPLPCGCPGTAVRDLREVTSKTTTKEESSKGATTSALTNWPIQLMLVPVNAPYLKEANLLIAADCAAAASYNFHESFVKGNTLLMGCPKLDDAGHYAEKLAQIIEINTPSQMHVIIMEVPCCGGLKVLVEKAIQDAKKSLTLRVTKLNIHGEILEDDKIKYFFS